MDSRALGTLLLATGLCCLVAVGGVAGETGLVSDDSSGVQTTGNLAVADSNETDIRDTPGDSTAVDLTEVGPFNNPGVYSVDVSDISVVSMEVVGPGGGGGSDDAGDAGSGADGGDGGYVEAQFDVSGFDELQITVGAGGGGGDSDSAGSGGDGFYAGASGGYQNGLTGWHSSGGGGGGATVVEGVSGGTTEPLAAAGGGGGGGAWDQYAGPSDNTGGGGGAAGGVGGAAEGGTLGGGSDGSDAEDATGLVSNDIGGDGGDSGPSSIGVAGDGGTWLNNEYVQDANTVVGGGASGGSGGVGSGGDGADGSTALNPLLVIDSLSFPDTVTTEENLTVEYTLVNTGETEGTESFVDLKVNGTNSTFDDTDQNVTVGPDEQVSGTLTFDSVGEFFDAGETIEFSVELWDYDDSASGAAAVEAGSVPELVVESLEYPALIEPTDDLAVEYTVENIGDEAGTESAVELSVGGTVEDTDEDVSVGAGETANGTLTFTGVEENYGDGETIEFAVSLADFGDSQSGETDVQEIGDGPALVLSSVDADESIPPAGDLTVEYTIDNAGDEAGTESAVELLVSGAVEDTDGNVTVGAGESATGTLTYSGVGDDFAPGETIGFTVALSEFGDSQSGETDLLAEGAVNLAVEPSSSVVDPGGVKTYEVVVEGADSGVLGYQGVVVELGDSSVGNITGFDEQVDDGDGVFSGSEIRNGGETLYLEAATGASFVDPGSALTIATFDVEAVGSAGATTDLTFDGTAAQTVASFETGQPYSVDSYKTADLILDAGEGPNLVLTDIQAPAEVEPSENLTVEYTVENFGGEAGTESAVTLSVNGSEADADSNVTLGSGEATSGTLTFEGVDEYGPGETIEWTVALADFGGTESGQTQLPGEADLVIDSLSYPDLVGPDEDLTVGYTLQNVGAVEGTESFVDLVLGGSIVDTDEEVTVGSGETVSGSLVFAGVSEEFLPGDLIEFTVELWDFGDTESGSTSVEQVSPEFTVDIVDTNSPVEAGAELAVTASVENVGDGNGTQSVGLSVDGVGSDSTEVTLAPGESTEETLAVGTDPGDAGEYTAEVTTENSSDSTTVTVADTSNPEFVVDSVETNAPLVEGKELTVTVDVENTGDAAGTQMVIVKSLSLGQASTQLSLTAGESGQAAVGLDTDIGDTGEYTLTIETVNDSTTEPVELHLPSLPVADSPPTDPDTDDRYEDVDGDSDFDIFDVQVFFSHLEHSTVQNHAWAYDFSNDGGVTIFDVQALFEGLGDG